MASSLWLRLTSPIVRALYYTEVKFDHQTVMYKVMPAVPKFIAACWFITYVHFSISFCIIVALAAIQVVFDIYCDCPSVIHLTGFMISFSLVMAFYFMIVAFYFLSIAISAKPLGLLRYVRMIMELGLATTCSCAATFASFGVFSIVQIKVDEKCQDFGLEDCINGNYLSLVTAIFSLISLLMTFGTLIYMLATLRTVFLLGGTDKNKNI